MQKVTESEKKNLKEKFRTFQKRGLQSYEKYLQKELERAAGSDLKAAYRRYIQRELESTLKKIQALEEQ